MVWLPTRRFATSANRLSTSDVLYVITDMCFVSAAWVAAVVLRYDGAVPQQAWTRLWLFLPVVLVVVLACHYRAGLYSEAWRAPSVYEARRVVGAQLASLLVLIPLVFFLNRPVPLSVPVIAGTLTVGIVGAARFHDRLFTLRPRRSRDIPRIVVIGAGSAGMDLVRDVDKHPGLVRVVAFLDDDPRLHGRRVHGVQVAGSADDLPVVAARLDVSYAVLAIPSASVARTAAISALADRAGVVLRVVPPLLELARGQVRIRDVRDIEIGDLLERQQIETDLDGVTTLIAGKRVLVTGAGGSIGSEIARQVSSAGAQRVVLLDHDETHLFDTAAGLPGTAVQRLADIRSAEAVRRVFAEEHPHLVFHAAAHKHVPLLEDHPVEAAETNVQGTRNVVRAALEAGVERLVFISTDKAVCPSSIMGATKSIGERLVLTHAGPMTVCAVRFGNVLGSRGSVVPTFTSQIRSGGPVTITDPRMTRYFMSIPEAVRLVLHAATLATGGEIFMLDMGRPVRILDLAHRMIRMSGCRPGLDIEIRITGIRPGEKLAEELHNAREVQHPTAHPSILRLEPPNGDPRQLDEGLELLDTAILTRDNTTARHLLMSMASQSSPSSPVSSVPAHATRDAIPRQATGERQLVRGVSWI